MMVLIVFHDFHDCELLICCVYSFFGFRLKQRYLDGSKDGKDGEDNERENEDNNLQEEESMFV